jgi:membrane protein
VKKWLAKIKRAIVEVRDFLDEKAVGSVNCGPLSRFHRFAHFWLMVAKSFNRNRCPIRAASLAYTTLLALIPVLAVALSVSSAMLKDDGEQRINHYLDKFLASFTPPAPPEAGSIPSAVVEPGAATNTLGVAVPDTNNVATVTAPTDSGKTPSRQDLVHYINQYIQKARHGSFGVLGGVIFLFIAISMLRSIEGTFNDIWGVARGRSWTAQITQFSAFLFLGPILLGAALGLAGGWHQHFSSGLLQHLPAWPVNLLFKLLPVLVLCLAFGVFYMYTPNTSVHWCAAAIGGLVGGVLWHLNNYFSALFVSRWVSNREIYGSLAVIPVFMVGLYFSWLIVLFGAQVAYAWQNRAAYRSEKQTENINQRGREFVALRLMQCIGGRFQAGQRPATVPELADALIVPTRLVQQIMQTLLLSGLVVEVVVEAQGRESAYSPARPLDAISCHDILLALRAGQGQELATRDDPARLDIYGEYEKILEAERQAASGVTVLAMASRAEALARLNEPARKAVTDGKQ